MGRDIKVSGGKLMARRVVVTGLGLVTPVGNTVKESWENIVAGKSGITPIEHFDATGFNTRFGGSVKDFDISPYLNPKDARKMDLFIQYGVRSEEHTSELQSRGHLVCRL